MKKAISLLIFYFSVAHSFCQLVNLTGTWKGSYIMDESVTVINFHFYTDGSIEKVIADLPNSGKYSIEYEVKHTGNMIELSRKNEQNNLVQFIGSINGNTISGTYKRTDIGFKDKPGVFQLMKSANAVAKWNKIPPFEFALLNDQSKVNTASFTGKYLLLDFWASWCQPCREKRPIVETIRKLYGIKDLEILSVSLDKTADDVDKFRKEQYPMQWKHALIPERFESSILKSLSVNTLPTAYLLDPEGKVVALSNELTKEKLIDTFKRIIK